MQRVTAVWREFYVNDAGNQIEKFGNSLEARYLQIYKGEDAVEFPEDGYHGDDIKERAAQFAEESTATAMWMQRRKTAARRWWSYALPQQH